MELLKTIGLFFLSFCFMMAAIQAMKGNTSTTLPRKAIHAKLVSGFPSQLNGLFYLFCAFMFLMLAVFS